MIKPDLKSIAIYLFLIFGLCLSFTSGLSEKDCEVCFGVVTKLQNLLESDEKTDQVVIEDKFKTLCSSLKKAEHRFCYYIGGLDESATKIVAELSKPLSYGLPVEKICERLKKKDSQVCDLRYEKQIDLKNVDLKTLRVRELKKILSSWDERCDSCIEKSEFIKRIEELKPQYVKEEL